MKNLPAVFKGNPFLTYRTMFLWGIPFFAFVSILMPGYYSTETILVIFAIAYLVWFLLSLRYAYYFIISENELQIRNHFIFWYKKTYQINEICSIRVDTNPKKNIRGTNPYFLRIYNTPVRYDYFYACTLREKHWRALQQEFIDRNIKVISMVPQIEIKFWDVM